MTPKPADARFSDDASLQAIHNQFQEPVVDAEPDNGSTLESEGEVLASALEPSMFSPDVQAYVERLLNAGENPSPALRQRLTRAAARGIDHQRKQHTPSPLPVLLAEQRKALGLDAVSLAATLQVEEADVYAYESGSTEVRSLPAWRLVDWARALDVPPATTVASLRRALELTRTAVSLNAAGRRNDARLDEADEKLLTEVKNLLEG